MSLLVIGLDALCTLNEAYWLYKILEILFERRDRGRKNKLLDKRVVLLMLVFVYFVIVKALNWITLTSPYTFVITMLYNIIIAVILWKCDVVMSIAIVGTYGLGLLVKDLIVMFVVGKIGGEELLHKAAYEFGIERLSILFICGGIWFITNTFFVKCINKRKINVNNVRYLAVVCIIGFVGLLFLSMQLLTNFVEELDNVIVLGVCGVAAIVVIPYFRFRYKEMIYRVQIMEERNELLTKQYDSVSEHYTSNAKLYHDMNNHLNVVVHMLNDGDNDNARNYIYSLQGDVVDNKKKVFTSIDIIDVILTDKEKKAIDKNIEFNVRAQLLPQDMDIEKKDLCAVFANILDNALEAAIRRIEVNIKISHRMLIIKVKNDFTNEIKKKNGYYQTTKENAEHHGWGLRSVESVVEKYDGSMECGVCNNDFFVDIIMNF